MRADSHPKTLFERLLQLRGKYSSAGRRWRLENTLRRRFQRCEIESKVLEAFGVLRRKAHFRLVV